MSIRIIVLYLSVTGLSLYAWKDWFKSLCGLIVLMAVIQHADMPTAMFGIRGLNFWNVLFGVIVMAWAVNRRREGLRWDMPRGVVVLLLMYLGVIVAGVVRAALDPGEGQNYPLGGLLGEELINTVKWVLPGLLVFDGCRTRKRVVMVLACLLVMYFLISVQVIRNMPPQAALGGGSAMEHARLRLNENVGYAATDLAVVLAGAVWGIVASLTLVRRNSRRALMLVAAVVVAFAMALTGGRGGYVGWGAAGLVLCLVKWRRYLLLAPVLVILLPVLLPGATARMLQGFGHTDPMGQTTVNQEEVGSGRFLIWPYVTDMIGKSPWVGYGRRAMLRTGLYDRIEAEHPGTGAPHPHNMYLETLFDNGLFGSIPIWLFWITVVVYSARLFRSANRLYAAIGGLSLALVLTSLSAGISGQHIYPQEHTLGMWAACFLSLRVYVEERRACAATAFGVYAPSRFPTRENCASATLARVQPI